MVLLAIHDRRVEIETGYAVESILSDGLAGEIIRTAMVPAFTHDRWGEGKDLTDALGRLYQELPQAHARAQKQALEAQVSDIVTRVMTRLRADPEAASTTVFSRLSDELAGAENRIAVERKRHNDAVAAYNRTARGFPAFLLRPVLGFPRQYVYFHVSEEAKRAPTF